MKRILLAAAISLFVACATLGSEASRVPAWDARGLKPLPWQGIACVDVSADGSVADEHPEASLHMITLTTDTALRLPQGVTVHSAAAWLLNTGESI